MAENDIDQIQAEVEARKKEEQDASEDDAKKEDPITPAFVYDCLNANERGDGALFAALHAGLFTFNKTSSSWYRWADHYWDLDVLGHAQRVVENVAMEYLKGEIAENFPERIKKAKGEGDEDKVDQLEARQKAYFSRVKRLRSVAGAQSCINWAHHVEGALAIRGEEFDRNPWLLACRNGVLELRTGKFRDGRPGDNITKAGEHKWIDIKHPAPTGGKG